MNENFLYTVRLTFKPTPDAKHLNFVILTASADDLKSYCKRLYDDGVVNLCYEYMHSYNTNHLLDVVPVNLSDVNDVDNEVLNEEI